jgi:CDP-diacylglycerol--serine O-phosphatidyltransferase
LCFGVAPAITLYLWAWADSGRFGWFLVMLLCTSSALRLARFNSDIGGEEPPWSQNFFVGVPAPAGAGTVLLPMVLWFHFESDVLRNPVLVGTFITVGALLQVSRVRTFSFKKIRLAPAVILPTSVSDSIVRPPSPAARSRAPSRRVTSQSPMAIAAPASAPIPTSVDTKNAATESSTPKAAT